VYVSCNVLPVVIQVNPDYVKDFESHNLQFVGQDEDGQRMEMLELKGKILDAMQTHTHFTAYHLIISPSLTHETCHIHCPKTPSIVDLQALNVIQVDLMTAGSTTNNSET